MKTTLSQTLRRLALLAGISAAGAAHAAYFVWETVELPASTGASCSNGSPYRFFVNRTPFTSKTVVMVEGGGACWEQQGCKGGTKLSAVNPNGVASNYMSDLNTQAHLGLVTPFTMRIDPLQSVQTQSWNIVYVTYCTGDVHTGNKVNVYNNVDAANPMTFYHRGDVNSQAIAAWMAKNMPRPSQLLMTGFSAGGVGSLAQYDTFRAALKPTRSALLSDSGPLFIAPRNGTAEQYPSLPLHNTIRDKWGLDLPTGLVTRLLTKYPGAGDANDLGSMNAALAKIYPNDRLGFALFQQDDDFSSFSYEKFYTDISGAATDDIRKANTNKRWRQDIGPWLDALKPYNNVGYYVPYERTMNESHCLTIVTFGGTGIKEAGYKDVGSFVDNLLGSGALIRAYQTEQEIQNTTVADWVAQFLANFI
ncbi:pectin acetylesterase-family hydrolase [Aquabacterium sp.]|uniref:pectin acetylesterase-family hydrolase n=1 Tax=Aquabacterium sp. TaxID=1872578 RepID=UPI0035AE587A